MKTKEIVKKIKNLLTTIGKSFMLKQASKKASKQTIVLEKIRKGASYLITCSLKNCKEVAVV